MSLYVIQRNYEGAGIGGDFVIRPGCAYSYTRDLREAWTFSNREAAQRQCCGNEHAVAVESLLQSPDPSSP